MKIIENKIYFSYILFGSLYFVSKVIFYIFGSVCARGVMLGLISTVLTVCVGIFAFKEYEGYKKANKLAAHWLAVLMPLFILPITPNYMIYRIYLGNEMFSLEKIVIFAIFECLAAAQIILAILMFRSLTQKDEGRKDI